MRIHQTMSFCNLLLSDLSGCRVDIFDYQDPKDLELCAEMIFVDGVSVEHTGALTNPSLLRKIP